MSAGLDRLQHIVVLMMENRSFDHMLGGLAGTVPGIDTLTGNESNPDNQGNPVKVVPLAEYRTQLLKDPDHHFLGADLQIFGGATGANRVPNMQGFVKSYFGQTNNVQTAKEVMYYFKAEKLPVLTTLAKDFTLFNSWFSSIPGPTICNRAFAHYGTSFGQVGMNVFYIGKDIDSIYGRLLNNGHTTKLYYYDQQSSTMEIVNLLQHQPEVFGTFSQFTSDCQSGSLPDYSFIEPAYNDHPGPGGQILASDQHPTHDVHEGERCTPDGFTAHSADTGTGMDFAFDRLGVRVPAILISPYAARTVVSGRTFEHASIPNTVTGFFLNGDAKRTVRESGSEMFLDLLTDTLRPDSEIPWFEFGD